MIIVAHQKSTPQKSSWIFSGIFQRMFSGIFQRIFNCHWYVPKDCHFSSGFHWNCPMDFNGMFQWNLTFAISGV